MAGVAPALAGTVPAQERIHSRSASIASRLKPHLAGRTLYAFFNNDYNANAPRNAATFRELLG